MNHHYLETDSVCTNCGAIINSYYEDKCVLCSCGGKQFVSGKVLIDIRNLLDMHLIEIKIICIMQDISLGSRYKMVNGIIRKMYTNDGNDARGAYGDIQKINEKLIRKMVLRNRKMFWYVSDIEKLMSKTRLIRKEI